MISILIPVYNQIVTSLVEELNNQAGKTGVVYEIRVLDDGSEPFFRESNAVLSGTEGVVYGEAAGNAGRSAARNLLAGEARYPYLLFLDGDSVIGNNDFIRQYLQHASPGKVVCGGRVYPEYPEGEGRELHFLYGTRRESKNAGERSANPGRSFMTNNFLVPADVFHKIRFDERLKGYGHEDTLFGFRLSQAGIPVIHIDNPVVHGELKTNREFLGDSLEAVASLLEAWKLADRSPEFAETVKLLDTSLRLKNRGLAPPLRKLVSLFSPLFRKNLLGKCPRLFILNLVKLEACLRMMSA